MSEGKEGVPSSGAGTGLPQGWDVRQDKTGRMYFVDHLNKKTQWTDPRPLPEGWASKFDERLKRHYFVNHVAKTTTWTDPRPPLVVRDNLQIGHGPQRQQVLDAGKDMKSVSTGNKDHDHEWYKDVLRMSLVDKQVTPDEEMLLAAIRTKLKISDEEHEKILKDCGWTDEEFKKVRKDGEALSNRECVICLDATSTHIILDCAHICLCEDCASRFDHTKSCPKCRGTIKRIIKTY